MRLINKTIFLSGAFLLGIAVAPMSANAFGLVVEHTLYSNNELAKLADFEKQGVKNELDIHQNLLTQIGSTAQIRQLLGDTRVMYEKDRLIATIKDYDTIMRSLMFFQVRDKDLIKDTNNKAFKNFYKQLETSSEQATSLFKDQSSEKLNDASKILKNILNNPKSPILQDKNSARQFVKNPLDAGTNFKDTMFLHAYYKENDKSRIPASLIETLRTYRKSLINEVATRNFLLGIYARAYLAERAEGNGIGRYLYGYDVVLWDEESDPWLRSWNIIGGFSATVSNFLEKFWDNQWEGLKTNLTNVVENGIFSAITDYINSLTGKSSGPVDMEVSSADTTVDKSSLSDGAADDIPVKSLQDFCTLEKGNEKAKTARDQYMECIWNNLSRKTDEQVVYSLVEKEKSEMRIVEANIRQMLSINTIMWVRASLELSNLILLSAAELEMEAVLAANTTDIFWVNPSSSEAWVSEGTEISESSEKCTSKPQDSSGTNSSDNATNKPDPDTEDGTSWSQDCLTKQERLWLTPSFDWSKFSKSKDNKK